MHTGNDDWANSVDMLMEDTGLGIGDIEVTSIILGSSLLKQNRVDRKISCSVFFVVFIKCAKINCVQVIENLARYHVISKCCSFKSSNSSLYSRFGDGIHSNSKSIIGSISCIRV